MDRVDELHKIMKECRVELKEIADKERKESVKRNINRYFKHKTDCADFHYDEKEYPDRFEYRKYLDAGNDDYDYRCFRFQEINSDGSYLIETNYFNSNDPSYFEEISAEEFYAAWQRLLQELSEINL
jgi:hypothetical protein